MKSEEFQNDNGNVFPLKKLYETNSVIDVMKEELTEMEPKLVAKSAAVAELMKNLTQEQKQADKVRNVVKGDEEVAKVSSSRGNRRLKVG